MELIRLNKEITDDFPRYYPDKLIEGWNSLIWSERYQPSGEFILRTPRIAETAALLPQDSLVSLRDSAEVQIVEDLFVEDKDGTKTLVVKGRTFDSFLDRRAITGEYGKKWETRETYSPAVAISIIIWCKIFAPDDSIPSHIRGDILNELDAVPDVFGTMTMPSRMLTPNKYWWLENASALTIINGILQEANLGLRSIRPPFVQPEWVDPYPDPGPIDYGDENKYYEFVVMSGDPGSVGIPDIIVPTPGEHLGLRLDVYKGLDRTINQSDRPAIVFSYDAGDLEDPNYLLTSREHATTVEVRSDLGNLTLARTGEAALSGLDRKVSILDVGSTERAYGATSSTLNSYLTQKGNVELKARERLRLLDAEVSQELRHVYGRDYYLGDKVTTRGEYGFDEDMYVSEYIRTHDEHGERGFPTLATIPEDTA